MPAKLDVKNVTRNLKYTAFDVGRIRIFRRNEAIFALLVRKEGSVNQALRTAVEYFCKHNGSDMLEYSLPTDDIAPSDF